MMTNKLLKAFTLATGLTAGATAFGAGGDIYEIRPCTQEGTARAPYATIANPLTSGESVYFKVRLIQRTKGDASTVWKVEHVGAGSQLVDDALYPLQIGIYVSGQLRYATLIDASSNAASGFTDLVFEYKTRAGDFALPVVLAAVSSSGDSVPASDSDESLSYLLNRTDKWSLGNDAGQNCNLWFWTPEFPVTPPDGTRSQDYSLSQSGIYVQTVDFDGEWEVAKGEPGQLWRSVHQNSTITVGATPKLEAIAAPEDAVTLHVWSTDDSAVRIKGGHVEKIVVGYDGVTPIEKETVVGDITLAGGQMTADFQIEGVAQGKSCNLVLSPWVGYNYSNGTGARIQDYVEVPVKCIEPMPPTVVVECDRKIAYADGDYMNYGALLTVYLSQGYDASDLEVTVTPTFADGATAAWGDYVRFSTTQDEVTALPEAVLPKVTIPAGSTAKQQIYAFFLRGDTHTSGSSRMVFTPSITDEAALAEIHDFTAAGLEVRANAPVITTPSEGAVIDGICGDDIEFTLAVSDTYADISDDKTGYKIFIKYRSSDAFKQLDGVYYVGEGNVLMQLADDGAGGYNKTTNLPIINYPASGEGLASQVYVVSPVSGKKSEVRNFTANIKEARTSNVVTVGGADVFHEGDQATFQITISEKNDTGSTIYAFLKASDNVKAGMISGAQMFVICDDTDLTKTKGLPINNYQNATAASKIKFLDGYSEDAGGLGMTFEVVLCTSQTWNPAKKIAGYDSNYLNLTVFNLDPTITRVEMNGFESEGNGYVFPNKVPKGMTQSFVAVVADKGQYDVKNTEEPFQCKWTATLAGVGAIKTETIEGDPATHPFVYDFPRAGEWTLKLQVKDKDMEDWSETTYSIGVSVLDNPQVMVIAPESLYENDRTGKIQVQLSYWDSLFTDKLKVKVTVSEYSAGKANAGFLKLDNQYADAEAGVYYVEIGDALPVDLLIEDMDGTEVSSLYGFTVKAEVVSDTELPTSHTAASEYYVSDQARVLVNNMEPVCIVNPQENTNRWEVAGGVAMTHPIRWQVKSDVEGDFTGIPSFPGIKVSFLGCQNASEQYVTESASGVFYPDFGDSQGDQDVTLIIEDKDGGYQSWTWQFKVTPSKFLTTIATGPFGGMTSSPLSKKYSLLGGNKLGQGHTWVDGATFSSAKNFNLRWNCSKDVSKQVYAFGYKVARPNDDGTLDGMDIALDPTGGAQAGVTPAQFYRYPMADLEADDPGYKDSFFYCWILHSSSGEGDKTESILGNTILPERPGQVGSGIVKLPTEQTQDGSYVDTQVEAIFAKEWMPSDNLGDINQDGVPDAFAMADWNGGNLIALAVGDDAGEDVIVANDLRDLAGGNPDQDFLPGCLTRNADGVTFGVTAGSSYAPIGLPFTTRLELRGFAAGLNATDLTTSDIDFDEYEQAAWEAYARANVLDPSTPDLKKWTPEPTGKSGRMDPTMADTDGDGLPDGWEYFFWYSAHVWYPAGAPAANPRTGQKYVYERFNVNNILEGDEIPAADVEARFNPCEPLPENWLANDPDFDNDGLSDLEELILGTNPTHWDTDGDHMCDGWEVMMSLDPLNGSKTGNADGDYMAYFTTYGTPCIVKENGATVEVLLGLVPGRDWDTETKEVIRDVVVKGFTFAAKQTVDGEGHPVYLTYGLPTDVNPKGGEAEGYGFTMVDTDSITPGDIEVTAGTPVDTEACYVLVHDQVRDAFGFDPRTGWYKDAAGYVASRWNPGVNQTLSLFDTTGVAVNTRAYNDYDEYLVMKYRLDYGIVYSEHEPNGKTTWDLMRAKTTNPSIVVAPTADDNDDGDNAADADGENADGENAEDKPDTTTIDISNAVADAFHAAGSNKTPVLGHGADTDGDGVPDGWELYMYRNPSAGPDASEDGIGMRGMADFDGDRLPYAAEYAGTDSCNAYAGCPSIYAHHPGNATGWFNKFFPTHPGSILVRDPMHKWDGNEDGRDTDGDGVWDSDEGGAWATDFYNDGNVFETKLGFVYGTPADDGIQCCIRGAGMNPCSVDSDLDGIPDGWEMQHAGVPVNAATLTTVAPKGVSAVEFGEIPLSPSTFVADGLTQPLATGNEAANADENAAPAPAVIYIAGGMDATWPGDATTDPAEKGLSYDELLKTSRDVDFDHDGLQNFQEYQVQAVRHFRYDDMTTPLMGRLLEETDEGRTQKFLGYMPFDNASAEATAGLFGALADAANDELARVAIGEWNEDVWRQLGYFASPAHEWDRAITCAMLVNPAYMVPVIGEINTIASCAGYVTTDPRMADTDGDGMDDFYEMFHGLNPILGTDPVEDSVRESNWVGGKKGDIVSAVWASLAYPSMDPVLTYNAYWNPWIMPDYNLEAGRKGGAPGTARETMIQAPEAYDPVLYPWIMGSPMADADGDGIRNANESVKANVTSPAPLHSDPTPLWFTEATTPSSFVAQYYAMSPRVAVMNSINWNLDVAPAALSPDELPFAYMFNFEEGEGYDTDNDMVPDSREVTTTATRASDVLRYDDPNRRQALWFNGTDGFAMTPDAQYRPTQAVDLFKQFTVECWVCPEQTGVDQTIIDRSCAYEGDALNKDARAIRANFRVGLAADGRVYGMFDNDDALESGLNYPVSCQRVYGMQLPLNRWSHVALAYDGKALSMYVNGALVKTAQTSLIPANGTRVVQQNAGSTNMLDDVEYTFTPGFLYLGARPKADGFTALPVDRLGLLDVENDSFYEHFKGYVDEVRIWDGARSSDEIANNYLRRYTFDNVKANRDAVYASALADGTRNDNDGLPDLPAELIYHYNFMTLPGALNAADVAKEPVGFTANVLGAAMNDYAGEGIDTTGLYVDADMSLKGEAFGKAAGDMLVGWWSGCPARSTVYSDYHVIPWIENTVGHLPRLDGGCDDTLLYSERTVGAYLPAEALELEKFTFANSANPYASVIGSWDIDQRLFMTQRAAETMGGPLTDVANRFSFSDGRKFNGSTDLVPMGGAFAKACTAMWDGMASDNWEYTRADEDADGLPDWWEEYARNNYCENVDPADPLNWDTLVTYRGMEMTASQAYLIDIALGLQPDGTINEELASRVDSDHNGIPDWWEKIFGVDGAGSYADSDNDGLSNYAEYLLSFVFDLGKIFDPGNAYSVNDYDIDYFFPIGQLYAGEIFSDNDMMEDDWEGKQSTGYVNRFVWDAASDNDEDGWSAFAECRYANFVSPIVADGSSHMLGEAEMKDFPIPTLKLTLRYNQSQQLVSGAGGAGGNAGQGGNADQNDTAGNQEENTLAPIIVKTYTKKNNDQADNVVPDAVFKIRPGEAVDRTLYLGAFAKHIVRGTLTPGYVDGGSFDMEFYPMPQNENYTWTYTDEDGTVNYLGGTYEDYMYYFNLFGPERVRITAGTPEWVRFADDGAFTITRDGESSQGYICFKGERAGEIDLTSGEFSFDMSKCERWLLEGTNSMVNVASSVFRINYRSKLPVLQQNKLDLFLGTPNVGAVREGKNRIVAFYDTDDNGEYTPGEPLGFAGDVDVSWKQGAATIELTDTTPVITRMTLAAANDADNGGGTDDGEGASGAVTDRFVLYGNEDGDYRALAAGHLSGGDYQRIRIVRTLVNGYSIGTLTIPNTVVVDKWIHLKQRPYIFEGDVLSDTSLDLDWEKFQSEVLNSTGVKGNKIDVTNVVYRIVLGNGSVSLNDTNNLFSVATVRHFDPTSQRVAPTLVSPGVGGNSIVYAAHPTFKWTMGKYNTYTAFQLQIMKGSSVVWDSGTRRAPARDANGNYTFEADAYVGDALAVGERYTWRVTMYNAKFRDPLWSTNVQTFVMNPSVIDSGAIDVCVKYFGPALADGTVRVEAFDTPDFTGMPVARAVADATEVATYGVEHKANAKLIGLPKGTYYVRAYVDSNTRGTRSAKDDWESWGYACPRERSAKMFTPSTIVVSPEAASGQVVPVFIEDVDRNGNNLPDAWEVANGSTLNPGANNVTDVLTGGIAVNKALSELIERENATLPGGMAGQIMTTLASPSFQAMVFGLDMPAGGSVAATLADATEVVDGSVAITDAQFDPTAKTVTLTVEADVENAYANTLGGALYTFDASSTTVKCTVWRKATLAESGWTKVAVKSVTIGREAAKVVVNLREVDIGEGGFFKVTLEK